MRVWAGQAEVARAAEALLLAEEAAWPAGLKYAAAEDFEVQVEAMELPPFVGPSLHAAAAALAGRAGAGEAGEEDDKDLPTLALEEWEAYWRAKVAGFTPAGILFNMLDVDGKGYLEKHDWTALVTDIMHWHPGLAFLEATPEFQLRYVETVIVRLYYSSNRSKNMRMTLEEIERSDIWQALLEMEAEADVNKVLRYFSYEHFYVLYCKFWELDSDRDHLITMEDLLRYANHSLVFRAIKPIFDQVPRRFESTVPDTMCYEDFVWFCLAEEDKTTETSIEYWFAVVDFDGDGLISQYEMEFFYEEMIHRMTLMGLPEKIPFSNVYVQLIDMVRPELDHAVSLTDLKRCGLSSIFFNTLVNISKLIWQEHKEITSYRPPHLRGDTPDDLSLADWSLWASSEYARLVEEEEE